MDDIFIDVPLAYQKFNTLFSLYLFLLRCPAVHISFILKCHFSMFVFIHCIIVIVMNASSVSSPDIPSRNDLWPGRWFVSTVQTYCYEFSTTMIYVMNLRLQMYYLSSDTQRNVGQIVPDCGGPMPHTLERWSASIKTWHCTASNSGAFLRRSSNAGTILDGFCLDWNVLFSSTVLSLLDG